MQQKCAIILSMPVQRHTGPMLISASLCLLGVSLFFMITGVRTLTSETNVTGIVTDYGYTNNTCMVCSTVYHGYPNCQEYPYSGAVLLVFNNCSDMVAVNVCGSTPEKAEKNAEELYKIGTKFDGYMKKCEFHFFRAANGWGNIVMGIVFLSICLLFLGLGIYFTRKFNIVSYQSL